MMAMPEKQYKLHMDENVFSMLEAVSTYLDDQIISVEKNIHDEFVMHLGLFIGAYSSEKGVKYQGEIDSDVFNKFCKDLFENSIDQFYQSISGLEENFGAIKSDLLVMHDSTKAFTKKYNVLNMDAEHKGGGYLKDQEKYCLDPSLFTDFKDKLESLVLGYNKNLGELVGIMKTNGIPYESLDESENIMSIESECNVHLDVMAETNAAYVIMIEGLLLKDASDDAQSLFHDTCFGVTGKVEEPGILYKLRHLKNIPEQSTEFIKEAMTDLGYEFEETTNLLGKLLGKLLGRPTGNTMFKLV